MPAVMLHALCWNFAERVIGADAEKYLGILYDIMTNVPIPAFPLPGEGKSFGWTRISDEELIRRGENHLVDGRIID